MPAINLARRAPADKAYLLALAERWLRPVDRLDYMIRRWAIPVPLEVNRSAAASMLSNGLLSEVQAAIGRYLRADLRSPSPTGSLTFCDNLSNEAVSSARAQG
jgi:hypothetical protein